MFKCNDCNKFFEQPVVGEMEQETGYVEKSCPFCGSDYFEDASPCPLCGEPTTEDFCQDCYKKVSDRLNELKAELGADQDQFEDIIANHFGW